MRHGPVVLVSAPLDIQFETMVKLVHRFYEGAKADTKPPLSPAPPGV